MTLAVDGKRHKASLEHEEPVPAAGVIEVAAVDRSTRVVADSGGREVLRASLI